VSDLWQQTYHPVVERLTGLKDLGNGRGRAHCPVHGDTADLWLSVGDKGRLVVRCYPRASGSPACRVDELVKRMGLELIHLYPDWQRVVNRRAEREKRRGQKQGGRAVRPNQQGQGYVWESAHDYELPQDGNRPPKLLFQVQKKRFANGNKDYPCRRPNPDFDFRRPEGPDNRTWLYNLTGITPILFRLPELRAALRERPDRWVFALEGEKDVETARTMGLVATCNPGGVLKWKPEFAQELKGCNVVVGVDEDPLIPRVNGDPPDKWYSPGMDHARQVCLSLVGVANTVKVLRFPAPRKPGDDLTDWYDRTPGTADGRRTALMNLVKVAPVVKTPEEIDACLIPPAFGPAAEQAAPAAAPAPVQPVAESKPADPPTAPPAPPPASPPPAAIPADVVEGERKRHFTGEAMQELYRIVEALDAISARPRSPAEWYGMVWMSAGAFQAAASKLPGDLKEVRELALHLAAHLIRGVGALPLMGKPQN